MGDNPVSGKDPTGGESEDDAGKPFMMDGILVNIKAVVKWY